MKMHKAVMNLGAHAIESLHACTKPMNWLACARGLPTSNLATDIDEKWTIRLMAKPGSSTLANSCHKNVSNAVCTCRDVVAVPVCNNKQEKEQEQEDATTSAV